MKLLVITLEHSVSVISIARITSNSFV
uniref:Uncharacterized protein n=1 Tax=Arundo donax TaxID=35708 RepID=A0A0A9AND9_ARUDO